MSEFKIGDRVMSPIEGEGIVTNINSSLDESHLMYLVVQFANGAVDTYSAKGYYWGCNKVTEASDIRHNLYKEEVINEEL